MVAAVLSAWTDARAVTPAAGLLGLGFWVQGFRCFAWLGMGFFLKDALGLSASAFQFLRYSANLPRVGKPLYGVLSDAVYIRGAHRLPYIALGAVLQSASWLAIALLPNAHATVPRLSALLLLAILGAAVGEVANDAIVAETGRESGRLQSFAWMCSSVGGLLGNLLCGALVPRWGPRPIILAYASVLAVQSAVTLSVSERSLDLPPPPQGRGRRQQFILSTSDICNGPVERPLQMSVIAEQLAKLLDAIQKPEVFRSLSWLAASCAAVPVMLSTMFYYQTQHLGLDPAVVGASKVVGQAAMLAWSFVHNGWLRDVSPRRLMPALQAAIAVVILSDVAFVKGLHRRLGLSDAAYAVAFSGLLEVMVFFKVLPFSVLMARLCPPGCEGSLMAFTMSTISLSMIVSGYLGVALVAFLGISAEDFSGLTSGIVVQASCAALPLFWSSWISDGKPAKKQE